MESLSKILSEQLQDRHLGPKYQQLINAAEKDPDVKAFLNEHQADLTKDDIIRSASKLYEYVNFKNKLAAGEKTFMPGYYPYLTLSNHHIEVTYTPTKEYIARQKQKEVKDRVKVISLPKSIRNADLSDYTPDGREEILDAALRFFQEFQQSPREFHKGLYLEGSFGVGKTYLLGALANALAEKGFSTTLVHFPSFAVKMKSSISSNSTGELIDAIKKAPILMLDDIGADQMSSWFRDDVLGVILQYRMQEELPTFFSSNLSLKQLEEEYLTVNSRGEAEPLKAKRIMERIRFLANDYHVVGRNRRN
ncbi:primosomal protein DnaI [Ligilactobacillus pobuzihii]|uniref:Primosomal protein DnaI n=1 Tax=Ligilactobacillus pobuzihii TaxID=449659 RepID=A0A0R2LM82_9LACO|nr:primosomal protein DnaI [Ligilactobacillus pobuzihii]KRK11267.1 primosomal protein DnaI [Ligilactobacillus pobuzihii E100301 = KCTC 13174]KRO02582.1 primosomal protein DnaI [Ligilactobacillus pobuzihii]GEN47468.1 primosomal protein DnaI [Ligilactobacillus pobuzihii]